MSCFQGNVLRQLLLSVLAATLVGAADVPSTSSGRAPSPLPVAARETAVPLISEVLTLRPRAERGDVAAQVALGDLFDARQQYPEAVYWYRLAATNGDVTAQLALAGSLIAGKGVAENRREAAHWMRRAADGVEQSPATRASLAPATSPSPSPSSSSFAPAIILTRSNAVSAAVKTSANSASTDSSEKNLFTKADSHSTRTTRDDKLSVAEPKMQERSVGLQPATTPK